MASLESEWLDLEARSNNYFFLSWTWVQAWLETYEPTVDVLKVIHQDRIVGMVLIAKGEEVRFGVLNSNAIYFQQTGVPTEDQIWIEYNSILVDETHHTGAIEATCQFLVQYYKGWDELILGAVTESEATLIEDACGLSRHDLWEAPTYGVDLAAIRESGQDYLSTLSRNTRYQIRRAIKRYTESGEIKLVSAPSVEAAISCFDEIGPLHIARWGAEPDQSGYANSRFVDFHKKLIEIAWPKGQIDVTKIAVDGKPIGYFYNFIYRGRVYFYLSGLVVESDNTLKPGLLGHALCIQNYIKKGYDFYDFMGGGERYKASMATEQQKLFKISLQKKMLKFEIEKLGRRLKHKVLGNAEKARL